MFREHGASSHFQGESLIREEDAVRVIESEGDTVSIFLIPGIQYYTGQLFNIPRLTQVAHSKGITVGVDLAHAAGNVPLHLHDWGVDFAVWCTYKYLNSGAGGIAAIFVHEDWTSSVNTAVDVPALKGWWGNAMTSKFSMKAGSCGYFFLLMLLFLKMFVCLLFFHDKDDMSSIHSYFFVVVVTSLLPHVVVVFVPLCMETALLSFSVCHTKQKCPTANEALKGTTLKMPCPMHRIRSIRRSRHVETE